MLGLVQYFRGAPQYGRTRLTAEAASALTGNPDTSEMLLSEYLESADPVSSAMLERSYWTKGGFFSRSDVGSKLRMMVDRIIGELA